MARFGYARVSTRDQNPDHQIDALRAAGVPEPNIFIEKISGKLSSRPKLDLMLHKLRAEDQVVVTRLKRIGRNQRHLLDLVAWFGEHEVDFIVLEQGIDTSTPGGRLVFHFLAALAEYDREMIVEGTLDGLAAARARGRTGGRKPKLSPLQAVKAREMYDETGLDGKRKHTVGQIAEVLGVSRKTIYRHLEPETDRRQPGKSARPAAITTDPSRPAEPRSSGEEDLAGLRPVPARIRRPGDPISPHEHELRDRLVRQREAMRASRCPTCGNEPVEARARWQQRQDLAIVWLYPDPGRPDDAVVETHHCAHCQPHQQFQTIVCPLCGDGPMVAGDLADATPDERTPPPTVRRWLDEQAWRDDPDAGLVCGQHPLHRA